MTYDLKTLNDKFDYLSWSYTYSRNDKLEDLLGKTITEIHGAEADGEVIYFVCDDGSIYKMYHEQDCCESVSISDINGDINDLLNTPLTLAETSHSKGDSNWGTYTWTFYRLATIRGYVDIRWFGESNGYYSESVDFIKLPEDDGGISNDQT